MYKAIEKGKAYHTVTDVNSKNFGANLVINLEEATQEELEILFKIDHPFVIKDEPKSKKAAE